MGWQEARGPGTFSLDVEGSCIDLMGRAAQVIEPCLSCSPEPFQKVPGSSQSWPYVTRLAPSSAGQ